MSDDATRPNGLGPEGREDLSRAESLFQTWLDAYRADEGAEGAAQRILDGVPADLRSEVEVMIADYERLRARLGDGSPGFEAGRVIGDFRLVRELGRGGMGVVWEAEQLSMRRRVALKLLFPHLTLTGNSLARFQREAEAGGRVVHPSIVQVYAVGEADGVHYMAQELVPSGYTLADLIAERRDARAADPLAALESGGEGAIDYARVAILFEQVARALGAAHAAGVVHRDVKPSNILLADGDVPKVADFGLAHVEDALTLSRSGELMGTPFYMSPEQAASRSTSIDGRTDVFSLGATLYEALTHRRAFDGDTTAQVVEKIRLEDPPEPRRLRSRVPEDLDLICRKALEKDPATRYATMEAFADDLARHLAHEPIHARPPGAAARVRKWTRRHPVAAVACGITGVAFLVVSALAIWAFNAESRARVMEGSARRSEFEARRSEERALESAYRAKVEGYSANLYAAQVLIENEEHGEAVRRLEGCMEELRDFEWGYLSIEANPGIGEYRGHAKSASSVAFHPDGELVASGSRDGMIRIWNVRSDDTVRVLEGHRQPVHALAFLPGGERLVSASGDRTLAVWRVRDGTRLARLEGHEGPVTKLAISPDGTAIASGSWDTTVRLWSAETYEHVATIDEPEAWLRILEYSPDGRSLVVGTGSILPSVTTALGAGTGRATVTEASHVLQHVPADLQVMAFALDGPTKPTGERRSFDVKGGNAQCAVLHPEAQELFVGLHQGRILKFDLRKGRLKKTFEVPGGEVASLAIEPDGDRLVAGSEDRAVRVIDSRSGKIHAVFHGHRDSVEGLALSPDGRRIASCSGSNDAYSPVRLWDASATGAALSFEEHVSPVMGVDWHGDRVATCSWDDTVVVRDAETLEVDEVLRPEIGSLAAVALGPCGLLACGGREGLVRVYDLDGPEGASEPLHELQGLAGGIRALDISPDGKRLASASRQGSRRDLGRVAKVEELAFGREVRIQAQNVLQLWDVESGELVRRLEGHRIVVHAVEFSPDGALLASGSIDDTVRLWDGVTGEPVEWKSEDGRAIPALEGHEADVTCVTFGVDGERLVSGSKDRTLRVWNVSSGECLAVLKGHEDEVTCVAVHPGGKRIAAGAKDGTIRLWDMRGGGALLVLRGHLDDVTDLTFDEDGGRLLSTSGDKTLRVWESELDGIRTLWDSAARRRRLEPLVRDRHRDRLLEALVIEDLEANETLTSLERASAIRLAREQADASPSKLLLAAWKLLRDPLPEDRHAEVEAWIAAARSGKWLPTADVLLGVLRCRQERFAEALEALEAARDTDESRWRKNLRVGRRAFTALALAKVGRGEEARETFAEARALAETLLKHEPRFLSEVEPELD